MSKVYEIGYLLTPLVPEEGVLAAVDEAVRVPVEKAGAQVTGTTAPKRQRLAYTVGKTVNHKRTNFNEAYFGAFRFEAEPEMLAAVKHDLDKSELVIRFIIVNLPQRAEPPAAVKRPLMSRRPRAVVQAARPTARPEFSKEDIDKEIDELLYVPK